MTSGSPQRTPEQDRARQVALFVLGVAVVLLVSSVTWFGSDRAGWGVAQVVVGLALAAVGAVLLRRSGPRR
ncbi:hypothetical protein [Candidatus Blastococcus massiliensis]|uniref:hypothetical protein n=1 Tax=Candidatus Blastococcus massiliensis TaxID=1470358 RepID=UPI0004B9961E|nr:hypothetical protein [Candidatus Blastococcus massiliensis]